MKKIAQKFVYIKKKILLLHENLVRAHIVLYCIYVLDIRISF